MNSKPPFRADHVGSLLRPSELREARASRNSGAIGQDELEAIEDRVIGKLIAAQERTGLRVVTDGEARRNSFVGDFMLGLEGVELATVDAAQVQGGAASSKERQMQRPTVQAKLRFSGHSMVSHFEFLARHTNVMPKLSLPAPAMLVSSSRDWREIVNTKAYPAIEDFYHDLGQTYRDAIRAFYNAGCRYLQLDDVNLAYFCDPAARARLVARGDDPDRMLDTWVNVVNAAIGDRPSDLFLATHICRGNFRSNWFAEGGYEPIAEALFNRFDYDSYFLEYDTDRAGSFEPLRYVPKPGNGRTKYVVLGLLTTKTGELENKRQIEARIEEATGYVGLNQLCLSPQCGFASTEEGNLLTESEQWDKLAEVVEIADEVWSDA